MQIENFNIRVYGILYGSNNDILLSNEHRHGIAMTKFVGGGLEKGEGIGDCLKREFKEEMDLTIDINELFYINDFFQVSAFNPKDQLISIYYKVSTNDHNKLNRIISEPAQKQSFKWVKLNELTENHVTFPIDKVVVRKIIKNN
jgi:ADP-ribose pyrophosphatase YjhB (NUDIX family)